MDYIAKQAAKAAKKAKDDLLAKAAASKVADTVKVSTKLSAVEQIEQILTKQLSIRELPPVSSALNAETTNVFENEVFLISGYSPEVCANTRRSSLP